MRTAYIILLSLVVVACSVMIIAGPETENKILTLAMQYGDEDFDPAGWFFAFVGLGAIIAISRELKDDHSDEEDGS